MSSLVGPTVQNEKIFSLDRGLKKRGNIYTGADGNLEFFTFMLKKITHMIEQLSKLFWLTQYVQYTAILW